MDIPLDYAITVGGNLLITSNVNRALLLIGNIGLRMGLMKDKSRVLLFGDCGIAVAWCMT